MSAAADPVHPPRRLRISPPAARAAAYTVAAVGFSALVIGGPGYSAGGDSAWVWPMLAMLTVGTVILHRWPTHPVGWVFLWLGTLAGASATGVGLVMPHALQAGSLPAEPSQVQPWVLWISLASEALNTASVVALVPLSLLLFPDGRLPSRRWMWVPGVALTAAVIGAAAAMLNGGWGGDTAQAVVLSPYRNTVAANVTGGLLYPLLMLAWLGAAMSMILRYRRTSGVERQQLKWLALAAGFAGIAITGTLVLAGGRADGPFAYPIAFAMGAPAVGAGIAILRHQLFDIDVVIRRSLIVGGLILFVTGFYVALVVGVGRLLGLYGAANSFLAVTATAAVAIAFQPVQQRLTRWANRLVYGQRLTPYEVLTTFTREIAGAGEPDALLQRAAASLADGTGAVDATVWMRVGDRLLPAAHHPSGDAPLEEPLQDSGGLPEIPGSIAVEVRSGGELLGAVTLTKPRGEPATATDAALAQRLADQIAVALTNLRLTAELSQRAEELTASRRRVLTAADDERRALERRLSQRSGQRLVALKTGMAVAQRTALSAPRTREQLEIVDKILDEGIEELHRLTRGLYPPLLEAEGLAVALRSAAERTGLQVHVDTEGVDRMPVPHETAIYFCVLEALANVAKHAPAAAVGITLRRLGGSVVFSVVDTGEGFDSAAVNAGAGLANMRDRVSALDGSLTVTSAPGRGTTVSGEIPLTAVTG